MMFWMFAMLAAADDGCPTGRITTDGVPQPDLATALAAAGEGATIEVCDGTYLGSFVATVPVHLVAPDGPELTVLDGGGAGSVLALPGGSSLIGFTVTGGSAEGDGGGLQLTGPGESLIEGCTFTGNHAALGGGAVSAPDGSTVRARNSRFVGNTAAVGGAFAVGDRELREAPIVGAVLDLQGSVVSGNVAEGSSTAGLGGNGGGIVGYDLTLLGGEVTGNEARSASAEWVTYGGTGGGVSVLGTSSIVGTVISGNSSMNDGGGVRIATLSTVVLDGVVVEGNETTGRYGHGGGVSAVGSRTTDARVLAYGSEIVANSSTWGGGVQLATGITWSGGEIADNAAQDGGGVYISGGHHAIEDVTVRGNAALRYGGGIAGSWYHPLFGYTVSITGAEVSDNVATIGTGGGIDLGQPATITDCELKGNVASAGGGISMYGWSSWSATPMPYTLVDVEVKGNEGTVSGGGLFVTDFAEVTASGLEVKDNVAPIAGGLDLDDGVLVATGSELKANTPDDVWVAPASAAYVDLEGDITCTNDGCPGS